MGFTKLDENILQSSIMGEDDCTFKVWIALLAACREDGIAPVSLVYIASICKKTNAEVLEAIKKLESPDEFSRSTNHEGKRIERINGGYRIINYMKYRERTYSDSTGAVRQRRFRDKKALQGVTRNDVTESNGDISASASASELNTEEIRINTNSEKKEEIAIPDKLKTPEFVEAWEQWRKHRSEIRKPLKPTQEKAQLKNLNKYSVKVGITALERSIRNGWAGVFPETAADILKKEEDKKWI